jgi:hypothetical protein
MNVCSFLVWEKLNSLLFAGFSSKILFLSEVRNSYLYIKAAKSLLNVPREKLYIVHAEAACGRGKTISRKL